MRLDKETRIAVLAGGTSCEREISLISGQAVYAALQNAGYNVVLLDPAGNFIEELKQAKIDLVFIALHGSFGEDGTLQEMLDKAGIFYTGSGARASRLAFDKSKAQLIFRENGVSVPKLHLFENKAKTSKPEGWEAPYVIKPACCGSSVGVTIVRDETKFEEAVAEAFRYSDIVLMEQFIAGRELTVGILGDEALPVVEVIASRSFYDYQAKYKDGGTRYETPARITPAQEKSIVQEALRANRLLGCQVMSRVDVMLGEDGRPYVLEINTIPGFTGKSLLPKAALANGIDFTELCVRILELSLIKSKEAFLVHGKTS